ncbi:MAG TPA: alcohol dehydrogenase, partial [Porticoccus sp.]|nr:alcohol dehydrogenase [Porticoccus sp.]
MVTIMRTVVFESNDKPLSVQDLPMPEPGPGQLLLKVKACGICGSDLHAYQVPVIPPGMVMGHEFTGEVVALGNGTEGEWSIG